MSSVVDCCHQALSSSAVTVEQGAHPGMTPLNVDLSAPSGGGCGGFVDSGDGVTFTNLTNSNPCFIYLTSREAAHGVMTPSNVASRHGVTCTVPRVSAQGEDVLEC